MHRRTTTSPPLLELELRPCPTCGGEDETVVAHGRDYEYDSCANVFTFVRCASCSTVFLNPRPRREDLHVIYPETYYSTAEASGQAPSGKLVRAAWDTVELWRSRQLVGLLPEGASRVLDVGCGDGRLLRAIGNHGPTGCSLCGVDKEIPAPLVEAAAAMGITLYDGLFEELPFPAEHFDLVVAQQVIEHTLDPALVLGKIRDELKIGGHAVFDMPSHDGLDRSLFGKTYWGGYHFPRHMTLFTRDTFASLARRAGLSVVSTRNLASPVFWIMSLHNLCADAGAPPWLTSRLTYRSVPLLAAATALEATAVLGLRPSSNMRVVLRKDRR